LRISIRDGAIVGGAWAASVALIYNLCHWIFRCGCTWAWGEADRHCNVHHEAPPHCPWCSHGWSGFLWVPAVILLAEAAVILVLRRRGAAAQMAGAVVTYFAVGAAAGLFSALHDGYPVWLGFTLP
jgi:hypothetical protein